MVTTQKPRYALYTRISKDPTGQSTAPARQEKECRKLAKERGFDIVDVFTDTDLSAYRRVSRPAYEEMLDGMAQGLYDGVLVWKLDRLVRRVVEFARFWEVASKNDVALVSKEDQYIDTTNGVGLGIVFLIVGLAQQESDNTSARLQAKEREMAEDGRPNTGRRAYGHTADYSAIVPEEAKVIRDIADRLLAGEKLTSIVRDLNEREVPTATGIRWSRQTARNLMRQARLFGKREHLGQIVADGDWPAIIDEATGLKLRQLLASKPGATSWHGARTSMLSGILRCGKCGGRMKAGTVRAKGEPQRHRMYTCFPKADGGCGSTTIRMEPCDETVSDLVLARIASPNVATALKGRKRRTKGDGDVQILRELAGLGAKTDELAAAYAADDLDLRAFTSAQRKIDQRVQELNEQLAELRSAEPLRGLIDGKDGLRAAWDDMSPDRRRAVIDLVVDRIVVHSAGSEYFAARLEESLLEESQMAARAARNARWLEDIASRRPDELRKRRRRHLYERLLTGATPEQVENGANIPDVPHSALRDDHVVAELARAAHGVAVTQQRLSKRRRQQALSRRGGGGSFRPERLEPVWKE